MEIIAGGLATWDRYVETGRGMGHTLMTANEMAAHVLCDRGPGRLPERTCLLLEFAPRGSLRAVLDDAAVELPEAGHRKRKFAQRRGFEGTHVDQPLELVVIDTNTFHLARYRRFISAFRSCQESPPRTSGTTVDH